MLNKILEILNGWKIQEPVQDRIIQNVQSIEDGMHGLYYIGKLLEKAYIKEDIPRVIRKPSKTLGRNILMTLLVEKDGVKVLLARLTEAMKEEKA